MVYPICFSYTAPRLEDEELEQELNELSEEERRAVEIEVSGTHWVDGPEESPEFVAQKLKELQEALWDMDLSKKRAYLQATYNCPDYVFGEEFLLPFLRATAFEIPESCYRICHYWEEKIRLFGEPKAFRGPISLADLEPNDIRVLRDGGAAWIGNDVHGRAIIHLDRAKFNVRRNGRDAILRAKWYVMHVANSEEEVQRKGMVHIQASRAILLPHEFDRLFYKQCFLLYSYFPSRTRAFHLVHSSKVVAFIRPYLLWLMGKEVRIRYRSHFGSDYHLLKSFQCYGILHLPRASGGNMEYDGRAFLRQRRVVEGSSMSASSIDYESEGGDVQSV